MTLQRELWVENQTLRYAVKELTAAVNELREDRNRLVDELAREKATIAALLIVLEKHGLPTCPPVSAHQLNLMMEGAAAA